MNMIITGKGPVELTGDCTLDSEGCVDMREPFKQGVLKRLYDKKIKVDEDVLNMLIDYEIKIDELESRLPGRMR